MGHGPGMLGPIVKIIRWFHHQFSITNLDLLIYDVCGLERMPEHILRYMGQMSNNNKS